MYNEHRYHYGYFVTPSAILKHLDPMFGSLMQELELVAIGCLSSGLKLVCITSSPSAGAPSNKFLVVVLPCGLRQLLRARIIVAGRGS
jgi:hypothetical protein